jgi:hypothetical protein
MKTQRHCAYNLTTGEILTCGNGNQLKRSVAIISRHDKRYYGCRSQWVFGHQGIDKLNDKVRGLMVIPQW